MYYLSYRQRGKTNGGKDRREQIQHVTTPSQRGRREEEGRDGGVRGGRGGRGDGLKTVFTVAPETARLHDDAMRGWKWNGAVLQFPTSRAPFHLFTRLFLRLRQITSTPEQSRTCL